MKLKVTAGQMRSVQLIADPSLQMLPLVGPDAPAVRVRTPAGQPQIIELQWARPVTDGAVVNAEFLLTGASSVGNLRLPQLDLAEVRPTKRWLAVSVDPALEHQEQMPGRLDAVAVPEFAASWGAARPTPLWACRLAPGASRWSIATWPRRPEITVNKTLVLDFDGHEAAVELDAKLTTSSGGVFQHRLLAPPGLKVDRIAVSAGGLPLASRWSVDSSGAITVFLMDPAAAPHELTLRGRLPAAVGTKLPLPQIEVESARVQSFTVQLYRRPSVLVEVDQPVGLTEVKQPPAEAEGAGRGRLVAWLRAAKTASPTATLVVLPNRPSVEARQIIRLARQGTSWTAVFDCRLKVSGGVLDQIVLDAPLWRKVRPKIKASGALRLVEGRDPNHLTLQPPTAITGDYQFTLRGPLAVAAGRRASVPQIALQRATGGRSFVVLPTRLQGELITWDVQGLQPVSRPELAVGAGGSGLSSRGIAFPRGGPGGRGLPRRRPRPPGRYSPGLATRRILPRGSHLRGRAGQDAGVPLVVAGRFPLDSNGGGGRADAAVPRGGADLDVALGARGDRTARGSCLRRRRGPVPAGRNGRRTGGQCAAGCGDRSRRHGDAFFFDHALAIPRPCWANCRSSRRAGSWPGRLP